VSTSSRAEDSAPHTLLVVDDTASKRYIIGSWLRRAGHRVEEAATGQEALDRAGLGGVDLVVLDIHLPDVPGPEVRRRLKAGAATAAVPVLHISAVATEVEDRSAGLDEGADAYLVDPIEPRELVSTVAALLRLYDARRAAEVLATRLRELVATTLRLNAATALPQLLTAAAEGATSIFGAPSAVLTTDADDGWVFAATGPGVDVSVRRTSAALVGALLRDLRAGPRLPPEQDPRWALLVPGAAPVSGYRLVPVRGRSDQPVAALALTAGASASADDDLLAQQLTLSLSVALENLRVRTEEHRIALTLQRSLLPVVLPELPGLSVAARYEATDDQAEIGGDFFDAFELGDGTAVIAIGDVQGHSLLAATIMAQLRHSLRAYAHEGHAPDRLVDRLNQLMLREHPEQTATVCALFIAPDRRSMRVVNAGHIPPLQVTEGEGTFLEESGALLGVESPPAAPTVVLLPVGTCVVLVTDGLVERRSASLDDGLAALASTVAEHTGGDLDVLADEVMAALGRGNEDDIALIAVRTQAAQPLPAPGRQLGALDLPAVSASVGQARRFVRQRLRDADLEALEEVSELVVSELASNAVFHARTDYTVEVVATDEGVRVLVHDRSPAALHVSTLGAAAVGTSGRGLSLVRALATRSGVVAAPDGGKAVWAELRATAADDVEPGATAQELWAAWDEPDDVPGASGTRGAALVPVTIPDLPVPELVAAKEHLEDLVREVQLALLDPTGHPGASADQGVTLDVARRLDAAARAFHDVRHEVREQALRAAARGDARVTLQLLVPEGAAEAAARYREALEDAEVWSRTTPHLTGGPGLSRHRAQWSGYLEALLEQLRRPEP